MKKKIISSILLLNSIFLCAAETEKKQLKGDGVVAVEKIRHGKENLFLNSSKSLKLNLYVALNDIDSVKVVYKSKGKKIVKDMELMETEGKSVIYSVDIDIEDKEISYYFIIKDGSKNLYFGEKYSSKEKECKPFKVEIDKMNSAYIPVWIKESKTGYEIVIDRFRNGDSLNEPIHNEFSYKLINPSESLLENGMKSYSVLGKNTKIMGAEDFKVSVWGNNWNKKEYWEQKIKENGKESRRYGGDLIGIKDKLKYLSEMGVDTIYISSPFYSGSSYKDDVIDFRHIDPSFGRIIQRGDYAGERVKSVKGESEYTLLKEANDDIRTNNMRENESIESWVFTESDMVFTDFIKEAHKNGIRVVVDITASYISCDSLQFKEVLKNGPNSFYSDWFVMKDWKNRDKGEDVWNPYILYDGNENSGVIEKDGQKMRRKWVQATGTMTEQQQEEIFEWNKSNVEYSGIPGQTGLVKINYTNKEAAKYIKNSALKWIKGYNGKIEEKLEESDGIDGIKFMSVEEVENKSAFKEMIKEIKQVNKEIYIVAETIYENRSIAADGNIDGILNYGIGSNIYKLLVNNNKEKLKPTEFVTKMKQLYNGYPKDVIYNSLNILDSADSDRVFSMVINPDRDYDRMNGSENDKYKSIRPDLYSDYAINLFKSMVEIQMILPGIPVVYYGDENGMWGADDPECRKPMLWDDIKYDMESDTLAKYKSDNKKWSDEVETDEANGKLFYPNKINEEISKFYKIVMKFRSDNKELLKNGEVNYVYADDAKGAIAVERKSGKKSAVVVINLTDKENIVKLPLDGGDYQSITSDNKFSVIDKLMEVKLKPKEGLILMKK